MSSYTERYKRRNDVDVTDGKKLTGQGQKCDINAVGVVTDKLHNVNRFERVHNEND